MDNAFIMPETLQQLRGPTSGTVVLPKRLLWNPSRPFRLNDPKRARSLLRIVLREARLLEDLEEYVSEELLRKLWSELQLPSYISEAWEKRFPELKIS